MSRLFLCLGAAFLATGLAAALFGFGVASDEDLPGARVGSLVAAGLAVVTLGSGVLLRRWERTVGDLPARRTGSDARRPRAETPGGGSRDPDLLRRGGGPAGVFPVPPGRVLPDHPAHTNRGSAEKMLAEDAGFLRPRLVARSAFVLQAPALVGIGGGRTLAEPAA
jgi:hypothetical protein